MSALPLIKTMDEVYDEHKREILSSGHDYAVILNSFKVIYYDDEGVLYSEYPGLDPAKGAIFAIFHRLIDIKKENSRERRGELEGITEGARE